jgi:hypothetical protein
MKFISARNEITSSNAPAPIIIPETKKKAIPLELNTD